MLVLVLVLILILIYDDDFCSKDYTENAGKLEPIDPAEKLQEGTSCSEDLQKGAAATMGGNSSDKNTAHMLQQHFSDSNSSKKIANMLYRDFELLTIT